MQSLYEAERSPLDTTHSAQSYQAFGLGKKFFHDTRQMQSQVASCAIVDLTNLPRVGFRGQDSANYLANYGFRLPEQPNQAIYQEDGSWIGRLSQTEYLVLGAIDDFGERVSQLEQARRMDDSLNYLLPRQDSHAWIQITGVCVPLVMAKLCGVDLSTEAFLTGQIAQTSVARINAIVINVSDSSTTKFNLLCDRAAALYMWEVLQDAIGEFKGQVIGINSLM